MKNILSALLLLVMCCADAATTLPVQLINPTGSTSGQAIVSTGASSAPAWGTVPSADLSPIVANTVLGNATGSTATPTAVAMPSCTAGMLQWTSGAGFSCGNTVSTLTATGLITPAYPAGIVGNKTGSAVTAGSIGEKLTGSSTTVSASAGIPLNCASVTLTAGDWDVQGVITWNPTGTTTMAALAAAISTTSATVPAANTGGETLFQLGFTTGTTQDIPSPSVPISVSISTPVYLVGFTQFGTSTMTCSGIITARRR